MRRPQLPSDDRVKTPDRRPTSKGVDGGSRLMPLVLSIA